MKNKLFAIVALVAMAASQSVFAQNTPSPEGAGAYFVNLENGAVVSSPVKVIFGLSGMGVAPAGTEKEHTGHHHLLIDRPKLGEGPDGAEELINGLPSDENHVHFGGGQTEMSLELSSGTHSLQLVLGDMNHVPHSPTVASSVITITVE